MGTHRNNLFMTVMCLNFLTFHLRLVECLSMLLTMQTHGCFSAVLYLIHCNIFYTYKFAFMYYRTIYYFIWFITWLKLTWELSV